MRAAIFAVLLAACGGGNSKPMPDAPPQPMPDAAMPDAPPQMSTLTSYVIDLVKNQTANNTAARPYSEFQTLPDPDTMNGSAYSTLFP